VSKRSIELKQQHRRMGEIRKQAAAKEIPFSGVEYPRGTPERRRQNDRQRQRDNFLMLILAQMYLTYQAKRGAVFV
jgi:hypothetical protein